VCCTENEPGRIFGFCNGTLTSLAAEAWHRPHSSSSRESQQLPSLCCVYCVCCCCCCFVVVHKPCDMPKQVWQRRM